MFCRLCGKSIPEDSRYCPYCGEAVVLGEVNPVSKPVEIETDNSVIPLSSFAQENGKMQLCKAASKSGELTRFILFTKETEVQLSTDTVEFSPSDIKDRKEDLVVHKYDDGRFVLELISPESHK